MNSTTEGMGEELKDKWVLRCVLKQEVGRSSNKRRESVAKKDTGKIEVSTTADQKHIMREVDNDDKMSTASADGGNPIPTLPSNLSHFLMIYSSDRKSHELVVLCKQIMIL